METSLADGGQYYINGQDGLISLTILGGGGKFDIRHDDGRVITSGNFQEEEDSEKTNHKMYGLPGKRFPLDLPCQLTQMNGNVLSALCRIHGICLSVSYADLQSQRIFH